MRREWRERFPRHRGIAILKCITTRVTHVPWCMPGSRFSFMSVAGKTFSAFPAHAQPALYVSGKRPMYVTLSVTTYCDWLIWHMPSSMTKSSNGNIFRVTGPLRREFIGHRYIPLTKASDAELWSFLWSTPEQTVEQTIETPGIWDAIALILTSLQWMHNLRVVRTSVVFPNHSDKCKWSNPKGTLQLCRRDC